MSEDRLYDAVAAALIASSVDLGASWPMFTITKAARQITAAARRELAGDGDRLRAAVAHLLSRCEEVDRTTWYASGDPSGGGSIRTAEVWEYLCNSDVEALGSFHDEVCRLKAMFGAGPRCPEVTP